MIFSLGLIVVLGALLGWYALIRLQTLTRQVDVLRHELERLQAELRPEAADKERHQPHFTSPAAVKPRAAHASKGDRPAPAQAPAKPLLPASWLAVMREHWMVALGGACLALAGVFLARYSIEQGLLGPRARFAGGLLLGAALIGGAEYLRRGRPYHNAFAALAAGGAITLYAALLAGLHLYALIGPVTAFVLLACVALATQWLALLHGPVLPSIGLLGAYLVPLLIGSDQDGAALALGFALLVSASGLLLLRHVYRDWLLAGVLAGGLGWVVLTLGERAIDGFRGLYLAGFAYLMLALPTGDWRLIRPSLPSRSQGLPAWWQEEGLDALLARALLAVMLTQAIVMLVKGFAGNAMLNWLPLAALLLLAGRHKAALRFHPWMLLLLQWLALFASGLDYWDDGFRLAPLPLADQGAFHLYCLASVLVYSGLALHNLRASIGAAFPGAWASLAVLAPLLLLALAFLRAGAALDALQWGLLTGLLGALYLGLGARLVRRAVQPLVSAWLIIGGHLAYALAMSMNLDAATLTLALAVQIPSLAWVIQRFGLGELGWLLKAVVTLVLIRLTFNPWLLSYPAGEHWSLWTYGGATVSCALGSWLLRDHAQLRRWTTGAALHLLALTLWTELRYWLHGGEILATDFSFLEAALNAGLFGSLALVYHLRARGSAHLARLYRGYGHFLMLFALANYAVVLLTTLASAPWAWGSIGERPLFNLMLLAFGLPVLLGGLTALLYPPRFQTAAKLFTALAGFVFISLQIRQLWHGSLRLDQPVLNGELYTYSAVWLLLAIAAILAGVSRFGPQLYRAGMLLLVLVLAKLFLVDMSDLQGLLRVASFLGMGLGLLATAYLHHRLGATNGRKTVKTAQ